MLSNIYLVLTLTIAAVLMPTAAIASNETQAGAACPDFLNHSFRKLHSDKMINLCDGYSGKPLLLVNTASHCGFTKQFKGLESLYKEYKDAGFNIVGFSSNDFKQAAKDEAKAADVCYVNYGVTFTMLSPTAVKGSKANPVFHYIASKTGTEPSWNFNKYLITNNGQDIQHYGSAMTPRASELETKVKNALAQGS